jgi:RNA polymerase primary sigma factor
LGMVFQRMEAGDREGAVPHPADLEPPKHLAATFSAAAHDQTDDNGCTPLHYAAAAGDHNTCRSLLAAGADPKKLDHDGRTASDHARSAGHHELAATLDARIETEAEIAARAPLTMRELMGLVRDDADIVKELIVNNRLVARDGKGDTPLHIVAMRGKLQFAYRLVHAGADIRALNGGGKTPSEAAFANGFAMLADLLSAAEGKQDFRQRESMAANAPSSDEQGPPDDLSFPPIESETEGSELWQLEHLVFEGTTDAADFHTHSGREDNGAGFQRVGGDIRLHSGFAEAPSEWEIGPIGVSIEGDGISERDDAEAIEPQLAPVGRRNLRRPALPSPWRRFRIDVDGCRLIVEQVVEAGNLTEENIDELLGLCNGRFDPVDLRRNLEREFEAAGYPYRPAVDDQLWDAKTEVDVDDLTEAVTTSCTRALNLAGTGELVPGQAALSRMTASLVEARRAALLGLAEYPRAIDIILYVADGVLKGEVASDAVSALVFNSAHQSADAHQFSEAIVSLRKHRPDISAGSSRAIRATADALELMEFRSEFLRDAVTAMSESAALAPVAARLARNLDTLDAGSKAILSAFIPLCRRFAAQNATDEEDQEDLFQVCFFGLRRAVVRFKPELGANFTAYAYTWLRQSVARWRADEGRLIRLPVHRQQWLAECRRAADAIEARILRDATPEEIAIELREGPEFARMLGRVPQEAVDIVQLDESMTENSCDAGIPETIRVSDAVRLIHEELDQLHSRQADVIRRRFGIGFDDEMTLEEVGQLYGVTRERIRQIETKGIGVLRHPARMRYLAKAL